MWEIKISHAGLNKFRVIRGQDKDVVETKATLQEQIWEEQWQKKLENEKKKTEKEKRLLLVSRKEKEAFEKTREAKELIRAIESILQNPLELKNGDVWDYLKDKSNCAEPPTKPPKTTKPEKPKEEDYKPKFNLIDRLIKKLREKQIKLAQERFTNALDLFKRESETYERSQKKYKDEIVAWEARKKKFYENQKKRNLAIGNLRVQYFEKHPSAVIEYCDMILAKSQYPEFFPQEFDIDFNAETGMLIVDYHLPAPSKMPSLKEVKYIKKTNTFKETFLADSAQKKMYDDALYRTSLRTIYELFSADQIKVLKSIVFNGWVKSIDKATGNESNGCILSIQANREEFLSINLGLVEPKECFRKLRGIGSSKLHGLAPVAPIIQMSREDKRFVASYDVADSLDEATNIAAMDWKDFENLIRELFEKEFMATGGEVKITQASRDKGVDAVAFDPDPIRGGKIIIQAKRYTNVVGVAAVRDLYGAVHNEGATKGILVTTSNYGPDAYEFAKGKPLTLINGAQLLYLLAKHGHKAKIDLKEAKKILVEEEKE